MPLSLSHQTKVQNRKTEGVSINKIQSIIRHLHRYTMTAINTIASQLVASTYLFFSICRYEKAIGHEKQCLLKSN
ncbi:hypothetical protein NC653_022212 [Populus alba x Populus x berolinensis]|uniref:Uncharacterized protein n=2 Tax=Populus alba x Populus x berolinensis TaxID=444605 RepID=A0AAD6QFW2_9ROSI|nr:hypothetical protein NC653_022212 [Populus alba x Populus x berolinensis]